MLAGTHCREGQTLFPQLPRADMDFIGSQIQWYCYAQKLIKVLKTSTIHIIPTPFHAGNDYFLLKNLIYSFIVPFRLQHEWLCK